MPANAVAKTTLSKPAAPRRRVGVYAFIGLLTLISFGYFNWSDSQDNSANNDFYRILYEASNKLNENLKQLDRMHVNGESVNSIRAQLPSYQRIHQSTNTKPEQESTIDFKYYLVGPEIEIKKYITHKNETDKTILEATLQITDILPSPKQGFSQYLFTDSAGKVLAKVADEKTISIDNLESISREIEKNKRRFQLNLNESQSSGNEPSKQILPSYSSHVDMELSNKEFRIFIFPFSLNTTLNNQPDASKNDTINTLYLVGVLPKHKLLTESSGYWNLSLLLVTLVSLVFMWTLLRLYLLPDNQSITPLYRYFTLVSSYAFFIVIIALVLAFMQKTTLQASKDSAAAAYARHLSTQLENNLYCTFKGLSEYRPFYHHLLATLDNPETLNDSNRTRLNNHPPATDGFSQMVGKALASITPLSCEESSLTLKSFEGKLPGYAFTSSKTYPIIYNRLNANEKEKPHADIELDQSAGQIMLQAYQKNVSGTHMLEFMAGNLDLKYVVSTGKVESYVSQGKKSYLPANIFTVLAINGDGNSTLPSIYYQENNAPPKVLTLAHRDYYKKVRDYQGWQPELCLTVKDKKNNPRCTTFNNVYIQRVLNMSDGTRGTSISMPMYDPKESKKPKGELVNIPVDRLAYTLGADVILPSLSLAAPAPNDFTYMVIDRNNGDVLFHSDESRTLVENLFYAGNGKSNLSQWIKAGLDHYPKLSKKIIKGDYHGQPGRFILIPAPLDAWAIVVFYPNDSLDALMVNQFLLISVSFAIALLALVVLLMICRICFPTNILKNKLSIPEKINGRVIVMISSIILSVIYSLYYIGLLFDKSEAWQQLTGLFSLVLPSTGILIILFLLFRIYKNHFSVTGLNKSIKGLIPLFSTAILLSIAHLTYLHKVAEIPIKALAFHYQQVHCNSSNYEKLERNKMALSRYPNSITQQRIDPDQLLPQASKLPSILDVDYDCAKHSSQVEPDDHLNLSSLMNTAYLWQWINSTIHSPNSHNTPPLAIQEKELNITLCPVVVCTFLILAIIWAWLTFVRRVLWKRLYCSERFLQHIERLTRSKCMLEQDQHQAQLIIECDRIKLNGIGLALLLRTAVMNENKPIELKANNLLKGFDTLYQFSPFLQKLGADNSALPNLKLNVEENPNNKKLDVQIWDIETCLAQAESRQHLLELIMEIKSLTLADLLNSFTIFTGYQSLQRVKMKDPLSIEKSLALEHAEYLPWAECLMDFNVKVDKVFAQGWINDYYKKKLLISRNCLTCTTRHPGTR